jgi:hypothetical protein
MTNRHLSDEDLLLFADREGSPRRAAKAREHLGRCLECRLRMSRMQETLARFAAAHEETITARREVRESARIRLKASLAEAARQTAGSRTGSPTGLLFQQFASACVALAIVACSAWAARELSLRRTGLGADRQLAEALPRRALTPGATRPVGLEEICGARSEAEAGPIDASLERTVFREYGLPASSRPAYELDYLITPQLGGSTDVRNLWPEPYAATAWNAHVKDELEDRLHDLVCQGKIPLETAQKDISEDWIAAYRRYFHTETPLANAATVGSPSRLGAEGSQAEVSAIQFPAW